MAEQELILYTSDDGATRLQLLAERGTVWLSVAQMAQLFDASEEEIGAHIAELEAEGELGMPAESAETPGAAELPEAPGAAGAPKDPGAPGSQQAPGAPGSQQAPGGELHPLRTVLAVGNRVRSRRGAQFRHWALTVLGDYLRQGFAVDEARLKLPEWDRFDELLGRIRDIRDSEARFYGKVRNLLALSEDYRPNTPKVSEFYRRIQNKMLYAVTSHTAAELLVERADPRRPNMGATSWRGKRVSKSDAAVAKNYLTADEVTQLNRIVAMFVEAAERRASQRRGMRLADWEALLDSFLAANGLPVLEGEGGVTPQYAQRAAHERYERFEKQRRRAEELAGGAMSEFEELQRIAAAVGRQREW